MLKLAKLEKIMKRTLLSAVLSLFAALFAIGASAQEASLLGTWHTHFSGKEADEEEGHNYKMGLTARETLTMNEGTFLRKITIKVTINAVPKKGGSATETKLTVRGSIPGTWTRNGNSLTLTPSKDVSPDISIDTEYFNGFLKPLVLAIVKRETKSELRQVDKKTILSLTDQELVVKDVVRRKRKDSDISTYTR